MQVTFNTSTYQPKIRFGDYGSIQEMGLIMSGGDCYYPKDDSYDSSDSEPSWDKELLKLQYRSPQELYDLAEYFHKFDKMELFGVCAEAYMLSPWRIPGTYSKLSTAVKEVQEHRNELENTEKNKEAEAREAESAMIKHGKDIIDTKFMTELICNYTPANAFLIYGNSEKKEDLKNLFYDFTPSVIFPVSLHFEETKTNNIAETYKELKFFANNILEKNNTTESHHGVFFIPNLDLMLKSQKTLKEKNIQEQFIEFVKTCSKKYHITVVGICNAQTPKEINNYQGVKQFIPLRVSYYPKHLDKKTLQQINTELARLDEKARQVYTKFRS